MGNLSGYISLKGVSKTFTTPAGKFDAIKAVDIQIGRGEHVAIVGKSGSGKSTLLNLLTGIDHPTEGVVTIASSVIHGMDESGLARWRGRTIGIVFQFFQLMPTLTVYENIVLAMDLVEIVPKAKRAGRARELLEKVGIAPHSDKLPGELSGGEQQRAAIARALANDPPILVADEPTGNLDSVTTDSIKALLADMAKAGKTVIVVTHEEIFPGEYERIITMKDGFVALDQRLGEGGPECTEY